MQLKSWLLYGSILFNMLFIGVSAIYLLPALTAGNREQPLPMPYEALDLSSGQKTAFEAERDTFHGVLGEIGQCFHDPLLHLVGCLLRKGDCQNMAEVGGFHQYHLQVFPYQ